MDKAVSHNKAAVLLWHVTALLRPLLYFVILLLLTLTLRIVGWKKKVHIPMPYSILPMAS